MTTIRIRNTEDAVVTIVAMATKAIASGSHPGHDSESVGTVMTSDSVLDVVRASYSRRVNAGATPKDAVIATGQSLVAHYCEKAGIPTRH